MTQYTEVHISQISVGDTVLLDGKETTVNASDLNYDPFMGRTLFGDSYHMGAILITRVTYPVQEAE